MASHSSRATAAELFENGDLEKWRGALESYGRVVQGLDSQRTRKKKQTKKEETLTSLDHWWAWLDTNFTLIKINFNCDCIITGIKIHSPALSSHVTHLT